MKFDVFFSICQTPVDGYTPSERVMFQNFFSQIKHADQLGFRTAWVAETHLSCQVQKQNPGAVIPNFQGEIGLNTDILQMAHKVFGMTKNINVGSAIRNIQCNGGPIAHAEAVKTFLSIHNVDGEEKRKLELGFAAGRFPFSNTPYGVKPRNEWEKVAWPVVRGKVFRECVEIFLRLLKGEVLASSDIQPQVLSRADFRTDEHWEQTLTALGKETDQIELPNRWEFDKVGVIPFDPPMENLWLTIGAHDGPTQDFANQFLPCGVFNLSFTPTHLIESTHERLQKTFHPDGGPWKRDYMPRTVLVFISNEPGLSDAQNDERAHAMAVKAQENYWRAIEGTIDPERIKKGVDNALVGCPAKVRDLMLERFNPDDRLMLWFDFNNHNNEEVKNSMSCFMEHVAGRL